MGLEFIGAARVVAFDDEWGELRWFGQGWTNTAIFFVNRFIVPQAIQQHIAKIEFIAISKVPFQPAALGQAAAYARAVSFLLDRSGFKQRDNFVAELCGKSIVVAANVMSQVGQTCRSRFIANDLSDDAAAIQALIFLSEILLVPNVGYAGINRLEPISADGFVRRPAIVHSRGQNIAGAD